MTNEYENAKRDYLTARSNGCPSIAIMHLGLMIQTRPCDECLLQLELWLREMETAHAASQASKFTRWLKGWLL